MGGSAHHRGNASRGGQARRNAATRCASAPSGSQRHKPPRGAPPTFCGTPRPRAACARRALGTRGTHAVLVGHGNKLRGECRLCLPRSTAGPGRAAGRQQLASSGCGSRSSVLPLLARGRNLPLGHCLLHSIEGVPTYRSAPTCARMKITQYRAFRTRFTSCEEQPLHREAASKSGICEPGVQWLGLQRWTVWSGRRVGAGNCRAPLRLRALLTQVQRHLVHPRSARLDGRDCGLYVV